MITESFGAYVKTDTRVINGPIGFQARSFVDTTTKEIVIAFAGTEGFSDRNMGEFRPDLATDINLGFRGAALQTVLAEDFITSVLQNETGAFFEDGCKVTYVGHS